MSSRNVALQKDIYDALRRERRARESFTQVISRLMQRRGGLEELRGSWGRGLLKDDLRHLRRIRRSPGGGAR